MKCDGAATSRRPSTRFFRCPDSDTIPAVCLVPLNTVSSLFAIIKIKLPQRDALVKDLLVEADLRLYRHG